ncbi:MAG: indole-3-glycerol phosphate synthase TrpC [Proteobacteria bacterium]|nr:indole-3-glycerol phosphate synthase TrpC [Pseudomonadota bacterium]
MSILDEIVQNKRLEVDEAKHLVSAEEMAELASAAAEPVRGLRRALCEAEPPAVIAEIKHRSPSRGEIRADFDAVDCAQALARGGAAALSVLTDERYFGGRVEFLEAIRAVVSLPILRKDFTIDPYQIDEARARGADAILLIVAALERGDLASLYKHAVERGLVVLVEVHDEPELAAALEIGADLVGVNNRDLRTFDVDLGTTERLAALLPEGDAVLLVAESGIHTGKDLRRLENARARAFLVGESLMREADPGHALDRLRRSR